MSNQKQKVLNFLRSGQRMSATQALGMFGIENVSARVAELRSEGYAIYSDVNPATGVTSYRLANYPKSLAQAAYEARGAEVFA